MSESNSRKNATLDYYTDEDYDDVMAKLPDIIKDAVKKAGQVVEPTVYEKREVMNVIREYIKNKGRIVYGGTALNEAIKIVNPDDAIYDEDNFSDVEFYTPTPVPDLVELTNLLYKKGYKYVQGSDAQHEGTYNIFVNFQLYCDISYVPTRVYNGIKTIEIDGIRYVHPHFALIDYLRMINDPLNAAAQRWEKAFKRMYVLLKNYPLEYFNKPLQIPKVTDEFKGFFSKIKSQFMTIPNIQESCIICGFEAYNFFIQHAIGDRTADQMARTTRDAKKLDSYITNVPFLDFVSVNYTDTVERLYNFIKEIVPDPSDVTIDEYFPLFQFTNYSVSINYKGNPIARIFEADGLCVPDIKTTKGYMYVTFQYLLTFMLINKFKAHLDKNREMYFNYGIAISNLVNARNIFLSKKDLSVINNTVFGEFRIGCVGATKSYQRTSQLRMIEKIKKGKSAKFRYTPEQFFSSKKETQDKFDPSKHFFSNTSGNKIINPKNLMFKIDDKGDIVKVTPEDAILDENSEVSVGGKNQHVSNNKIDSTDSSENSENSESDLSVSSISSISSISSVSSDSPNSPNLTEAGSD